MARWIGIDYGGVRTGIACTDADGVLAFPHATVQTASLMGALEQLVNASPCKGFVLGMPNAWGIGIGKGMTHSTAPILALQAQLRKHWPELEVHMVDETNSSEEALQASIAGGMKKSKRSQKGALDHVAATIILQRFLDEGPRRPPGV